MLPNPQLTLCLCVLAQPLTAVLADGEDDDFSAFSAPAAPVHPVESPVESPHDEDRFNFGGAGAAVGVVGIAAVGMDGDDDDDFNEFGAPVCPPPNRDNGGGEGSVGGDVGGGGLSMGLSIGEEGLSVGEGRVSEGGLSEGGFSERCLSLDLSADISLSADDDPDDDFSFKAPEGVQTFAETVAADGTVWKTPTEETPHGGTADETPRGGTAQEASHGAQGGEGRVSSPPSAGSDDGSTDGPGAAEGDDEFGGVLYEAPNPSSFELGSDDDEIIRPAPTAPPALGSDDDEIIPPGPTVPAPGSFALDEDEEMKSKGGKAIGGERIGGEVTYTEAGGDGVDGFGWFGDAAAGAGGDDGFGDFGDDFGNGDADDSFDSFAAAAASPAPPPPPSVPPDVPMMRAGDFEKGAEALTAATAAMLRAVIPEHCAPADPPSGEYDPIDLTELIIKSREGDTSRYPHISTCIWDPPPPKASFAGSELEKKYILSLGLPAEFSNGGRVLSPSPRGSKSRRESRGPSDPTPPTSPRWRESEMTAPPTPPSPRPTPHLHHSHLQQTIPSHTQQTAQRAPLPPPDQSQLAPTAVVPVVAAVRPPDNFGDFGASSAGSGAAAVDQSALAATGAAAAEPFGVDDGDSFGGFGANESAFGPLDGSALGGADGSALGGADGSAFGGANESAFGGADGSAFGAESPASVPRAVAAQSLVEGDLSGSGEFGGGSGFSPANAGGAFGGLGGDSMAPFGMSEVLSSLDTLVEAPESILPTPDDKAVSGWLDSIPELGYMVSATLELPPVA